MKQHSLGHALNRIVPNRIKETFDFTKHVSKYLLLSQDQSQTHWHVDFTGSAVFYTLRFGKKHFFFVDMTERNLAIYQNFEYLSEAKQM